jgi:hypothetical protein
MVVDPRPGMSLQSQQEKEHQSSSTNSATLTNITSGKQLENDDIKLELNPSFDLQQRRVAEIMMREDQPVFSVHQIRSHLKNDPSSQTIRRRLSELAELGIVNTNEYRNLTLYSINDSRSNWAVPGDLTGGTHEKEVTLMDLVRFQAPHTLKQAVSYAGGLSLYLIFLGVISEFWNLSPPISSSNEFVTAALLLMFSIYPLLLIQGLVDRIRNYSL